MIFRKSYQVKNYTNQHFVNGYYAADFTSTTMKLDIQPSSETLTSNETGTTAVTRLICFSSQALTPARQETGTLGTRVLWRNNWYECTSCEAWDGTPLSHFKSTLVLVPEGSREE